MPASNATPTHAASHTPTTAPPPLVPPNPEDLAAIRTEISRVDAQLVALLAERTELARRAGARKATGGLGLHDPVREAAVVRDAARHARALGLDDERVRALFWSIVDLARTAQSDLAGSEAV